MSDVALRSPAPHFIVRWIVPALPSAFGLFLLYFHITEFTMALQAGSWPRTTGILSLETTPYRREISYRYEVNGATYDSERIIFGELGNRTRSREWNSIADLPDGTELVVRYQPENPRESTIFTGILPGIGFRFVLGTVFLAMGPIMFAAIRFFHPSRPAAKSPGRKAS